MCDIATCHVDSRNVVIRTVPLYGYSNFSVTLHTKVDSIAVYHESYMMLLSS